MPKVKCKLVAWDEVVNWAYQLSQKILESGWRPNIIVAIARGGFVPARLLCDFMDIHELLSIQIVHWGRAAEITTEAHVKYPYQLDLLGKKVLIVDDICDTGDSLIVAKKYVEENWKPDEVKLATLQWISPVAKITPDYYVDEVKDWTWYQYPWTRLEDTANFIEKIVDENKDKKEWTKSELVEKFKEDYGIDVGEPYYTLAFRLLEAYGRIKLQGDKIVVTGRKG
ncbi:MAG TPA: phosphoribosyltransferase [Thermofilum sp.]|nr:phosphoribosyltransferase [Thermofilum sp.]